MKAINRKNFFIQLKKILLIMLGSLMLAIATSFFYFENGINAGGMSGLGVVLYNIFGIDKELVATIVSWVCFFIGFLVLGRKFALKTLCSTIVFTVAINLFKLIPRDFMESYFYVGDNYAGLLVYSIFGGVLVGVGCGLTFLGGGSTGGVDIPALILQKYAKIRVSYVSFSIDFTIMITGLIVSFVNRSENALLLSLIGVIAAFLQSFMMDRVFFGTKKSYIAYIISFEHEAINEFIVKELNRGATILNVEGGYSHVGLKMIKVCFDFDEYSSLKEGLQRIDPKAFVSVVKAHEINGLGFENKSEIFDETELDKWIKKNKGNKS